VVRKRNGNLHASKTRKLDNAQSVEARPPRSLFSRQDGGHAVAASRTGVGRDGKGWPRKVGMVDGELSNLFQPSIEE